MRRTVEEAAATREALLKAALPVFGQRGYAAATLDEIARCAGVTRGALYHHFAGKPELFLLVLEEGWAEVMAPLNAHLEGDAPPLARVRRFLVAYLTALEQDLSLRMLLQMVMFPSEGFPELEQSLAVKRDAIEAWTASLASLFTEVRRRGQLRAGLSPRNAAVAVVSFAYGVTTTWILCPGLFSPAQEAEQLADAVLEGIAA
ncbi:MAG: TetR family transcriptional regulator [Egibacteraceae bacterium]